MDTDGISQAMLQYRNIPIPELGLSTAQMLLDRQLCDHVPTNPSSFRPQIQANSSRDQGESIRSEESDIVLPI